MRITVDVMGTPRESGGMNLYARELLLAWAEAFPDDALFVVGGEWVTELANAYPRQIIAKVVRGRSSFTRFWTQAFGSGWYARVTRSDVLLSLSPIAALTFPAAREAAVIHDWRHLRRPGEFGRFQQYYRKLWPLSLRRVQTVFSISEKTHKETRTYAHGATSVVVRNGGDHPRRWDRIPRHHNNPAHLLTYGHFINKRPEAVIEAVSRLSREGCDARLTVLGATGSYAVELGALARRLGVNQAVDLPGFVTDKEYQTLLQSADVVILNSSDEGFGLPVVEARFFGIAVIGASDSGLAEIHGTNIVLSNPDPGSLASAINSTLSRGMTAAPPVRRWADSAREMRGHLQSSIRLQHSAEDLAR